tara:strand:- start:1080 stop:1955 length:876 start_codon:yes stop_codon:yes gene_type:complete
MTQYTIDQFSEITGITKFLLRTWENRYGYLKAKRTSTNIRIYDDYMLMQALNTNYLLSNGFKISQVAKLSDNDVIEAVNDLKINSEVDNQEFYINEIIASALFFDTRKFNEIYDEGVETYSLIGFYKSIILITLQRLGVLWLTNRVSPAHEHFLSELIKQKIASATDNLKIENPNAKKWLLFLPEDEYHEIGLLFAKFLLYQKGHEIIYLGANVPHISLSNIKENTIVDNTLLFSISNSSKSNLQSTLNVIRNIYKESNNYLITNLRDNDIVQIPKNIQIINDLDSFIKLI